MLIIGRKFPSNNLRGRCLLEKSYENIIPLQDLSLNILNASTLQDPCKNCFFLNQASFDFNTTMIKLPTQGPVLAWFNVVEAFKKCEVEIPVNLKFVFEAMEESGSKGLERLISSEKDKFLKNVDFVCISDSRWLGDRKPCLLYGMRGMSYFAVKIKCASKDLHSGVYGGAVHEGIVPCRDSFAPIFVFFVLKNYFIK